MYTSRWNFSIPDLAVGSVSYGDVFVQDNTVEQTVTFSQTQTALVTATAIVSNAISQQTFSIDLIGR